MDKRQENDHGKEETMWDEIKGHLFTAYKRLENWLRPSKAHPIPLQVVLFIFKLPVLLLLLLLSPVVLVILVFVFFAAL